MIFTILVGAGKGKRLNLPIPKSFVEIENKKLFLYSVEKFYKFSDKIFLAVPKGYVKKCRKITKKNFSNLIVVKGGKRRQDSVFNCLKKIHNKEGIVLIHDTARPFVSENLIKRIIEGTKKYGACIPVLKITDTVKEVEKNFVKMTLDREKLFIVQTPQGFKLELIKKAYKNLKKISGSDDSFFLEKIGYNKIYCEKGEITNFKITYPFDLIFAEFLIKKWAKE
ncbi:MAG: 2-C-methyl-D-erythritol 4-phosphate cytidylyltransferase [Candidatus Omnitrophica bacterium]|nr:2-C-methyl-D-erythritol 4-phosphate cytidylyltransferase [Candidatus Omnitrophota bacterium]MCM8809572.1 2-C-methyl-D-erythritol 4-phosphate cytidylyltransferase [Candidatus Omnitrophota bacterium]MCM8810180.1 2-C-methyl-D-erythritol 4-phosphate cytidylyltransferase [Candidatus Omnitrophota bacterium]MCM8832895.1 2-C-methyl-D-erythritol 4-phosphate cytidylyltransferase [Candidatus Omnitrophota bacterium]